MESVSPEAAGELALDVRNMTVKYGLIEAVRGVSFCVKKNQLVAIVGVNGAGKSSIMNSIIGGVSVTSGQVLLFGDNVVGLPSYRVVRKGMVLVPEGRHIIPELSVEENIALSRYGRGREKKSQINSYDLFPLLGDRRSQKAGSLSGGQQQMLAIARALETDPKVLLLDEPSLGLAPGMVDIVYESIERIRSLGVTVTLVEQDLFRVLGVADYIYVLAGGEIIGNGLTRDFGDGKALVNMALGSEIR